MNPLPRIADRMLEADQHLDRLGSILRSLRAPPERALGSSLKPGRVHQPRQQHLHQKHQHQKHQHQHQQQVQQQQQQTADDGFLHHSGPSPRSFTKPKRSQTEALASRRTQSAKTDRRYEYNHHRDRTSSGRPATSALPPPKSEEDNPATRSMSHAREQKRSPPPQRHPPPPAAAAASLSTEAVSTAPSSTVAAAPAPAPAGAVFGAVNGDAKRPPTFRERAVRTWWRGLSCGVCFAAGAWTRDGHGLVGLALALAAVCGEIAFHEWS